MSGFEETINELLDQYPCLRELQVLELHENYNSFGDAFAILGVPGFVLRYTRDKGRLFVSIGADQAELFDVKLVEAFLANDANVPSMDDDRFDILILGGLIQSGLEGVKMLFDPENRANTVSKLKILRKQRWANFLAPYKQ